MSEYSANQPDYSRQSSGFSDYGSGYDGGVYHHNQYQPQYNNNLQQQQQQQHNYQHQLSSSSQTNFQQNFSDLKSPNFGSECSNSQGYFSSTSEDDQQQQQQQQQHLQDAYNSSYGNDYNSASYYSNQNTSSSNYPMWGSAAYPYVNNGEQQQSNMEGFGDADRAG